MTEDVGPGRRGSWSMALDPGLQIWLWAGQAAKAGEYRLGWGKFGIDVVSS